MAQKFVVFPSDVTKEEIALWFSNNGEGVNGWWTGIPPFLQTRANEEGWVLPQVWDEVYYRDEEIQR